MTIFGAILLVLCVLGGSLIGPVSNLVAPKNYALKNAWRMAILMIYFFIPCIVET